MTVDGTVLERPVALSCEWTVVGVTSAGVLVEDFGSQGGGVPMQIWNPVTDQFGATTGGPGFTGAPNPAGVAETAGNGPFTQASGCSTSCRVSIVDASTARSHMLDLRSAAGLTFPSNPLVALSPNGRYLAVEEVSSPIVTSVPGEDLCAPACVPAVRGALAIFSTATGQTLLQRRLSFVDYSSWPSGTSTALTWSGDGSWVFLTASNRSIDAVPAFSATVPVTTLDLTVSARSASAGAESFVVTSAAPIGAEW